LDNELVALRFDLKGLEIHTFQVLPNAAQYVGIVVRRPIVLLYGVGIARHNAFCHATSVPKAAQ
jgi:hypothetical protein